MKKPGVAVKLLIVILILTSLVFIIVGGISWFMMVNLGNYSIDSSSDLGKRAINESTVSLEEDAKGYLLRVAVDQADITDLVFEQIISDMGVIGDYTRDAINSSKKVDPAPYYLAKSRPPDPVAYGVIHAAPGVDPDQLSDDVAGLSSLQKVFSPIYRSNHNLAALYVATDSGLLLLFPWTPRVEDTFDPRTRPWYLSANISPGYVWSEPYVDVLGGGLMITYSRKVEDPQGRGRWIIGADITIETINQRVITTDLGENGYAFLINQNGDVISRPGLTAGSVRWDELYQTENLLESPNSDLREVAEDMTAGFSGVRICRLAEGDKFIAYAPVKRIGWSIGIVLPVETVIAPIEMTRREIQNATDETRGHIDNEMLFLQQLLGVLFILLFIAIIGVAVVSSRYIVDPLRILKEGAMRIGKGDLESSVIVNTGDEFEDLAGVFNQMSQDLRDHISELRRTTAEKERFTRELEIAHGIQDSFLPDSIPEIPGIEIAVFATPALEVGGDFYDFIPVDEDAWGLVIADVSGKGVPAALFMALSRTLIRVSASRRKDPAGAITEANELICRDSKTSMFVTLFYLVISSKEREITYINAGHNPPLLLNRNAPGSVTLLKADGIALGIIDDINLQSVSISLKEGDLVVLYTDGITEAMNSEGEEFGMERLSDVLNTYRDCTAVEIIERIKAAISEFAGETPQSDDITLILIRSSE